MSGLSTLDSTVFAIYVVALLICAIWISRQRDNHQRDTKDYFLASRSLPWWAIGASLIAANISAEQIIGMSGSGYAIGIAIASYEWMAAITLLVVGKYFVPVFLKLNIHSMPQFLERRFDHRVKTVMAVFWLGVYIFVNLASILWLGGLAIHGMTGFDLTLSMLFLALLSMAYSLYGGLKAVALTDIVQVVLLILGGLFIAWFGLNTISNNQGISQGLINLYTAIPEKFDIILAKDNPHYLSLPGLSVLVGGMWVMHMSYWGFNQYIIQRALAAKSQNEAQKGILFAAILKLFMPIIVVLPGLIAAVLIPGLSTPDNAYPQMMALMPEGIKGLIFAALVAAIISSISSMSNSIATIFTLDLYQQWRPNRDNKHYLTIGRSVSVFGLVLALIVAQPLLGQFEQAFQYIQEFTGFFTPGIAAIFLLGLFWSPMNTNGALCAALGSAILSFSFYLLVPQLPFLDRVGIVFLLCLLLAVCVSLISQDRREIAIKAVYLPEVNFITHTSFNFAATALIMLIAALYATWW